MVHIFWYIGNYIKSLENKLSENKVSYVYTNSKEYIKYVQKATVQMPLPQPSGKLCGLV